MPCRMILRCTRPALAAVALTLWSAAASATASPTAPPTVTVAVLGLEAIDVPETIAAEVTGALRQKVTTTPGFRLVAGKDLVEIKLVFPCSDESSPSMAQTQPPPAPAPRAF